MPDKKRGREREREREREWIRESESEKGRERRQRVRYSRKKGCVRESEWATLINRRRQQKEAQARSKPLVNLTRASRRAG